VELERAATAILATDRRRRRRAGAPEAADDAGVVCITKRLAPADGFAARMGRQTAWRCKMALMKTVTIIPGRFDKDGTERARGLRAASCFWQMLAAAKEQVGGAENWYGLGLAEAEAALEAWQNGTPHGFFLTWEERRATVGANRPAPLAHEREARRLVCLMCTALERTGLNRRGARKFAAKELERAGVFAGSPSHRTLEYWQADLTVTPSDELVLATAIATAGLGHPERLAKYFIGLAHLVFNPAAVVVREVEAPENPLSFSGA
jgi:hypothetical protein